jgi:hypothetical protein
MGANGGLMGSGILENALKFETAAGLVERLPEITDFAHAFGDVIDAEIFDG